MPTRNTVRNESLEVYPSSWSCSEKISGASVDVSALELGIKKGRFDWIPTMVGRRVNHDSVIVLIDTKLAVRANNQIDRQGALERLEIMSPECYHGQMFLEHSGNIDRSRDSNADNLTYFLEGYITVFAYTYEPTTSAWCTS